MLLKPELLAAVRGLITQARTEAVQAVNAKRMHLYWHIGRTTVEEEQQGADRATYGTFLVQGLADLLQPQFGSGYNRSAAALETCHFTALFQLRPQCGRN